jgi:drug/metabolite transporter (DMT)-like permease
LAGLVHLPASRLNASAAWDVAVASFGLIAGIGAALLAMSLALQYGLARMSANRAIVILLFELVVAALAAYALAGEVMRPQDWAGGVLIVAASFASAWMERRARA